MVSFEQPGPAVLWQVVSQVILADTQGLGAGSQGCGVEEQIIVVKTACEMKGLTWDISVSGVEGLRQDIRYFCSFLLPNSGFQGNTHV